MSGIKSFVCTIDKSLAQEWLLLNTHNRVLQKARVNQYRDAMLRGEWMITGEAIKWSDKNVLLDGQHRLAAIVAAGVIDPTIEIEILVVEGLGAEAQERMDRGKPRSVGDALQLRGIPNASTVAAIVQWLRKFEVGEGDPRVANEPISVPQALELLKRRPFIHESVRLARGTHHVSRMGGSAWGALCTQFLEINFDDADEFMAITKEGANLEVTHPIFHLRRVLFNDAVANRRLPQTTLMALIIKAWNAWRAGVTIGQLRFTAGGSRPDKFPIPE